MKFHLIPAVLFLFMSSVSVFAQNDPKPEIFIGFSHTNPDQLSFNGWRIGGAIYTGSSWGWAAEASGHYLSAPTQQLFGSNEKITHTGSLYTIQVGPRYVLPIDSPRFTSFLHGLVGYGRAHRKVETSGYGPTLDVTLVESSSGVAGAFGGALDFKATDRLTLRLGQLDYQFLAGNNVGTSGARIAFGVVFHLK